MPVSSSRLSYDDCFTLFDRALEDPLGARYQVPGGEHGKTSYFIMRMHYARQIDRRDNAEIYEAGHKLHGRSVYDPLVCQLKQDTEGGWWVYVSKTEIDPAEIESLSELEGEYVEVPQIEQGTKPALELESVLQITDQTVRRRV